MPDPDPQPRASWFPLVVIVLAQLQMAINVLALPVSLGPIAKDLHAPTTVTATALLIYSLCVAAFVMPGAQLGKLVGERLVFRVGAFLHGVCLVLVATATSAMQMYVAQAFAGVVAAALVPTLVVLIATSYQGRQKATALGVLAGLVAVASAVTFLVAGFFATVLSWRWTYWMLVALAAVVLVLSSRLPPVRRQPGTRIDVVGVVLSASAIALILLGFNNVGAWGLLGAGPDAPVSLLGVSPALLLVVVGVLLGQGFFWWSHRRVRGGRQPLLAMEVLDSREERAAVVAFLVAGSLSLAVSFLIPIYVQIVQGRTPLASAVSVLPYSIAVTVTGVVSVRLYRRVAPHALGMASFVVITVGLVVVAATLGRAHSTPPVTAGLLLVGVGEGVLLTLLFNVLVSASPPRLAGDVGALRGVANNVSNALGAALASVIAVGLLGTFAAITFGGTDLPERLHLAGLTSRVDFLTDADLRHELAVAHATPAETDAALAANAEARLRALRGSFLVIGAVSLLAVLPSRRLPRYRPD